jgi:trimeric autotransporter adhesin
VAGTYYIIARADDSAVVTENNESNNTAYLQVTVPSGPADLTSGSSIGPGYSAASGATITFSVGTRNRGGTAAAASTTRLYLSTDNAVDAGDVVLGNRSVPSLAPGASEFVPVTVTIPAGTAAGSYYIITRADADGIVPESDETNNQNPYPVTVTP